MSETRNKTLALTLDDSPVSLTINRATARIGVARSILVSKGYEENKQETAEELKVLRLMVYPDCISCTSDVKGMEFPIAFEQFIDLPETFVNAWVSVVYEVNPHWIPELEDNLKNAPSPTSVKKTSKKRSLATATTPATKN